MAVSKKPAAAAAKNTAKTVSTEIAVASKVDSALPAYLQGQAQGSGLRGLDSSDFVIPRIKLLQGISPELETHDNAKSGMFWLNVLDEPLSDPQGTLKFIPISNKKRFLLLAPRSDSRGILARADDGIHWTPPDAEFEVRLKNVPKPVLWKTAETVAKSGLAEFGSSNPADPDSNPAATLFYEYLVYLPEFPQFGPVLLSLSRSQARKARDLNGKIELRRTPMQSQLFEAGVMKETHSEGDYWNYKFQSAGWAAEDDYKTCTTYADRYKDYRGADEEGAADEGTGRSTGKTDSTEF